MTILALRVFGPDAAVIWTDSECHSLHNGRPTHRRNKLVVGGSGVATIAGGWDALAREADHTTCEARDIDHAARLLPERLRQRCMKVIRGQGRDPREAARQVVLMAGYSPAFGRVLAYRFGGVAFFEPVLVTAEAVPDVPEFARLSAPVPEHVERIARAQMDALRTDYPEAMGGALTMAVVRPWGVETRSVCDLTPECLGEAETVEEATCTC